MVSIMGSVVLGLLSSFLEHMVPSLPAGLGGITRLEAEPSAAWHATRVWFHAHRFALLFAVVFATKAVVKLVSYSARPEHRDAAARLHRIYRHVTADWFNLVVNNAFLAFATSMSLYWAQKFSLGQLAWQFIFEALHPVFLMLGGLLPGGRALLDLGQNLAAWYGDNQFKFTFWLVYSAAICDDLGLPNFKALARWLWRRWASGRAVTVVSPHGLSTRTENGNEEPGRPSTIHSSAAQRNESTVSEPQITRPSAEEQRF